MRTLNWYITKNMLITAGMALGILTFVMLSGQFFRAFDLLTRGVSPLVLGQFLLYLMPDMLRFTLPLALLVATVLVFSRMSADNEVTAMKAIGVSVWQIVTPALALSFALCALCLWLSLWVAPIFRYKSEQLRWSAAAETPLALLEPGSFTEVFPNCFIRIGQRNSNRMQNVHIVLQDKKGTKAQDIVAKFADVIVRPDEQTLELALENAQVGSYRLDEPPAPDSVHFLSAASIRIPLDYGGSRDRKKLTRKLKYMDLRMLCARISLDREQGIDVSEHLVNLHERLSLALSPFAFLLLGLPFGIRSKRSELSVGLLACVLLALVFYGFMLLADAVKDVAWLHPQYIIWLPNLAYQLVGLLMIKRLEHNT